MGSTDLRRLERRALRGYELARVRRGLVGVLPVLVVSALAAAFSQRPESALGFGLACAGIGAVMLWYGRDAQRAVLPGVAAGLVPLCFALCANRIHACGPWGCGTLCVPACMLGGVVAGLGIAWFASERKLGGWFWLCASGLSLLTGAMGCACIGYAGLVGLVAGFAAGAVPKLYARFASR